MEKSHLYTNSITGNPANWLQVTSSKPVKYLTDRQSLYPFLIM
jgi:hypothetical protein